jgi:hypothetical protein
MRTAKVLAEPNSSVQMSKKFEKNSIVLLIYFLSLLLTVYSSNWSLSKGIAEYFYPSDN